VKVLDLFSGIGGFSLALDRCGMQTVAFCEADLFCTKILNKHWPDVPVYPDIRKLNGKEIGTVDLVCGGFPCQPWSGAGKGKGHTDDRDLWPEMLRVVREVKPRWVLAENVQGFVNKEMGLRRTVSDLEGEDYEVRVFTIPACGVKAPHQRYRVWIVAHSAGIGLQGSCLTGNSHGSSRKDGGTHQSAGTVSTDGEWPVAYSNRVDAQGIKQELNASEVGEVQGEGSSGLCNGEGHWDIEPNVGRVAHGVPKRVDRLKSLGNAVVPQIVEIIGRAILKTEEAF
jgi:DNA (cytosine-5)-methyltransferase 1